MPRRKRLCFSLRIFLEMEEGPLDEKYAKKVGLYCGTTLVGTIVATGFLGGFKICQQENCHKFVADSAELYRDDSVDLDWLSLCRKGLQKHPLN